MPMDLPKYQEFVEALASPRSVSTPEYRYLLAAIGLAGEAGEFADIVKKAIFHTANGFAAPEALRAKLIKELGDICWYVAFAANTLGVSLQTVIDKNVEKLRARYPSGQFDEAAFLAKEAAKCPEHTK